MKKKIQMEGELFEAVQRNETFQDPKTFVDSTPERSPRKILEEFRREKGGNGFDLDGFVRSNFDIPRSIGPPLPVSSQSPESYIEGVWDLLMTEEERVPEGSTLIPVPLPYPRAGGRFREMYYWDSYFEAVGLAAGGRTESAKAIAQNVSHLVEELGFMPNSNRAYHKSRSQPPFYVYLIDLLEENGVDTSSHFPTLRKEYGFWMDGGGSSGREDSGGRTVKVNGHVLNRYWDGSPEPRPESYAHDLRAGRESERDEERVYRDIRAACESGWDFSSRWVDGGEGRVRTTEILPVDLNSLLYSVERKLAELASRNGEEEERERYRRRAEERLRAVDELFWSEEEGYYFDWDIDGESRTRAWSLAGVMPLFTGMASDRQAEKVAETIENLFLKEGGVVTTLTETGDQWDKPNGWPPLQWITVSSLADYGYVDIASEIAERWIEMNTDVFRETGVLWEKYDVCNPSKGISGEYSVQQGFGWTAGVFSALENFLENS